MEQSMSRPDNCYDNAFLESCFGTLKTELEMELYADVAPPRRRYASTYATTTRSAAIRP
jgi:transposase InsO family protein